MTRLGLATLLCFSLAPAGQSQEFRFGIQGLAASPLAGFEASWTPRTPTTPLGTGAGLTLDLILAQQHALRFRADKLGYPKSDMGYGEQRRWEITTVGLDYLYYPGGNALQGWYLLGGVQRGYQSQTFSRPYGKVVQRGSGSGGSLGVGFTRGWLDLGMRYQIMENGFPQYQYSRQQSLQIFVGLLFGQGGITLPQRF